MAGLFACFASGSIQAITWKNYVAQHGVPQVVDGVLALLGKNLENIDFADIENKEAITELYLSENKLESLPAEIGLLIKLEYLDLSSNKLQSLPAEIGLLKNLQILHLYNNELKSLPVEISRLINLKNLGLPDNKLESLPAEIGLLTNLQILDLYNNKLQSLPPTFSKLQRESTEICDLDDERIQELQEKFKQNLKGFILQAIQNNNLVNVRKFTRSIVQRCELEPSTFQDEQNNNLLHLAVTSNMYSEGSNETWKVRDPEWKILKELIACNVKDSAVKMLQNMSSEKISVMEMLFDKDYSAFVTICSQLAQLHNETQKDSEEIKEGKMEEINE